MDFDFIICTNVYNRVDTLPHYFKSLKENTSFSKRFHVYMIVNYDKDWMPWGRYGNEFTDSLLESEDLDPDCFSQVWTPNVGLLGYNIGFTFARNFGNCPVVCCNDDTVFATRDWDTKLLTLPTKVMREGVEVPIRPESIGAIGPCYVNPGCMKHQKYDDTQHGFTQHNFIVGHSQLVTTAAIEKGFMYYPEICSKFGPFDIAQSMFMLDKQLNLLVNHDVCMDFPNSQESHFHEGDPGRWDYLRAEWQGMQQRLEAFQAKYKERNGGKDVIYWD